MSATQERQRIENENAEFDVRMKAERPAHLLWACGHAPSLHRLVLGVRVDDQTGQTEAVNGDLAQWVHVAVGGSSGCGKSMTGNSCKGKKLARNRSESCT